MRAFSPPRLFKTLHNRYVGMATRHRPVPEVPFNNVASKQHFDTGMPPRGFDTSKYTRQAIGRPLDVLEESPTVIQQRARHAVHPVVDHGVNHYTFNFRVGEAAYGRASVDECLQLGGLKIVH